MRVSSASILLATLAVAEARCSGTTTATDVTRGADLSGQVVVMTGGDSGIGLETAVALAGANANIVIGSLRPDSEGKSAAANITARTGSKKVTVLPLDLSSFKSVDGFASAVLSKYAAIDVLICDAGIATNPTSLPPKTEDGFERVAQVNYISHFKLVDKLLSALRKSEAGARVIHVSSDASYMACEWANRGNGSKCLQIPMLEYDVTTAPLGNISNWGVPASNYGVTKFFQIYHARELAAREAKMGSRVRVFSAHPGYVATPMTAVLPAAVRAAWCANTKGPCPLTAAEGASTIAYLAVASDLDASASGAFFTECEPKTPPMWVTNGQAELFAKSQEWIRPPAASEYTWESFEPGAPTSCSHGSPFAYFARAGDSPDSNLIVEFEGGGACFDRLTCDSPSYTRSVDVKSTLAGLNRGGGLKSGTDSRNPVLGWNHLFVPYCTGDVHVGNFTPDYNVKHVGRLNAVAALEWVKKNVGNPKKVFVTGGSAGSLGSYIWAPWVFEMFPNASHYQLGDSYVAVVGKTGYNDALKNWKLNDAYYPGISGLDMGEWHEYILAHQVNVSARAYPESKWGTYVSANDDVERGFYLLAGCGAEGCEWKKASQKALDDCHAAPNFASFRAPGGVHVATESDTLYSIESEGVKLSDWLTAFLNDQPYNNTIDCVGSKDC